MTTRPTYPSHTDLKNRIDRVEQHLHQDNVELKVMLARVEERLDQHILANSQSHREHENRIKTLENHNWQVILGLAGSALSFLVSIGVALAFALL